MMEVVIKLRNDRIGKVRDNRGIESYEERESYKEEKGIRRKNKGEMEEKMGRME